MIIDFSDPKTWEHLDPPVRLYDADMVEIDLPVVRCNPETGWVEHYLPNLNENNPVKYVLGLDAQCLRIQRVFKAPLQLFGGSPLRALWREMQKAEPGLPPPGTPWETMGKTLEERNLAHEKEFFAEKLKEPAPGIGITTIYWEEVHHIDPSVKRWIASISISNPGGACGIMEASPLEADTPTIIDAPKTKEP